MLSDKLVLAIDFDGTIVSHNYPEMGELFTHAKECINELYDSGKYYIIIWSCRTNQNEADMIKFLNENGIRYHSINENCPEFIAKCELVKCGLPRKLYYDILVDDRSLWGYCINFEFEWPMIKRLIETEYILKTKNITV